MSSKKNYFDIKMYIQKEIKDIIGDENSDIVDTLILSGGHLKGIAQLGVMHYMESKGLLKNITTIAGTSAGAVLGTFIALGFRPVELYHFFMNIDISKASNLNAYNLFNKLGLDDGKRFLVVVKKCFKSKSISSKITFKQLYKITNKTIIVTGACLNDKKIHYFSHDTHPDMKVIDALRISISIPVFFTPIKYNNMIFVDGGCIDNYPIGLFKHKLNKVIGVCVSEYREKVDKISSIETFLMNAMICVKEGMDVNSSRGFEDRTISIKCSSDDSKENISALFDQGYTEAAKFFELQKKK